MFCVEEVRIKTLERVDFTGLKEFVGVINEHDGIEINVPDQMLEFIMQQPKQRELIFLAYENDKIIGFGMCMLFNSAEKVKYEIIVHPQYRSRGLGSKLYSVLLESAEKLGVKKIEAGFKKSDISIRFAEVRGFSPKEYSWKMDMDVREWNKKELEPGMQIRNIDKEDALVYADIMTNGFKKPGEEPYDEKIHSKLFIQPNTRAFFLQKDAEIVATAAINLEEGLDRGYIYNVAVYDKFRGKGYGKLMLEHCVGFVKGSGLSRASLIVDGDNYNALKLYKNIGFVEIDTYVTYQKALE